MVSLPFPPLQICILRNANLHIFARFDTRGGDFNALVATRSDLCTWEEKGEREREKRKNKLLVLVQQKICIFFAQALLVK